MSNTFATSPLPYRLRSDLIVSQQEVYGETRWVLKDPLSMNFHNLSAEEYFLLTCLDEHRSAAEIKDLYEEKFAPKTISFPAFQAFLFQMHKKGFLLVNAIGQGDKLVKRQQKSSQQKWLNQAFNPLSLRWRGINPDRLLVHLVFWLGWCFHRYAIVCQLIVASFAGIFLFTRYDEFSHKLGHIQQFIAVQNWLWFAVALTISKVLHEFGHAIACKRLGGRVTEIGAMLLVLTPALYCNTNDSWMIKNRWHRMAIAAAGMYVEFWLTILSIFLWWTTHPGMVQNIAMSMIVVCSVSTILVNANPLMRFDGYYILSDLLQIPNLAQRASQNLQSTIYWLIFGVTLKNQESRESKFRLSLVLYAVLAPIYRWFVVFAIYKFLVAFFKPYGFDVVGHVLGILGVAGLVLLPLWQLIQFFKVPGRRDEMKVVHLGVAGSVLAALLVVVFLIPFPKYVHCSFQVQPENGVAVFAKIDGVLVETKVKPGEFVEEGTPIAVLQNLEDDLRTQQLTSKVIVAQNRLVMLEREALATSEKSVDLDFAKEEVQSAIAELENHMTTLRKELVVVAPTSGYLFPSFTPQPPTTELTLVGWHGSAFTDDNSHCLLKVGQELCKIGDRQKLEACLYIDQDEIEFVQGEQKVLLQLESQPGEYLAGKVRLIASEKISELPNKMSKANGGEIETTQTNTGAIRPTSTTYQACVSLSHANLPPIVGMRGHAKIQVGSQTLAQRGLRMLNQAFVFEF